MKIFNLDNSNVKIPGQPLGDPDKILEGIDSKYLGVIKDNAKNAGLNDADYVNLSRDVTKQNDHKRYLAQKNKYEQEGLELEYTEGNIDEMIPDNSMLDDFVVIGNKPVKKVYKAGEKLKGNLGTLSTPNIEIKDLSVGNRLGEPLPYEGLIKELQFDHRLAYYVTNDKTNFSLVDPINKKLTVSTYVQSLLGDDPEEMKRVHEQLKNEDNAYGTPAIMNPYSTIRLYGALESTSRGGEKVFNQNYAIDQHRRRRFYDVTGQDDDTTKSMVAAPSTTNIIRWSANDEWGRTPYRFQDFVFCKHWKVIENNRLITLRRYIVPTRDNLNFDGMYTDSQDGKKQTFSPLSTMVTYFGGDTGNKLSDIIGFSCGYNWADAKSDMYDVTMMQGGGQPDGQRGTNKWGDFMSGMFMGGGSEMGNRQGFGFTTLLGSIINMINSKDPNMGVNEKALYDNGKYPDPYSKGPWQNKVKGPINSINTVKRRERGLNFDQSLKLTFKYVSRPIGGINTKAVLLDILSNALVMGYSSAVFWKGGHRFNIKPSLFKPNGLFAEIIKAMNSNDMDTAIDKLCTVLVKMTTIPELTNMLDSFKDLGKELYEGGKDFIQNAIGAYTGKQDEEDYDSTNAGDIEELKGASQEKLDKLSQTMQGNTGVTSKFISGLLKYIMNMSGTLNYLEGFNALLNGDPVGDWHLTIGNPFNPIATIGNLIVKRMSVKFSDELGPDDFPLEMTVTYDLEHGMPRDSDAIQSMFNRGVGRIYTLPDWAKSSADFMTKVDNNIPDRFTKPDEASGKVYVGWDQETAQQIMQYDPQDELQNKRNTGGKFGGNVKQETMIPSNSGSVVMNIPTYVPMNHNQLINFKDTIADLDKSSRGIYFVDDFSKYANATNKG